MSKSVVPVWRSWRLQLACWGLLVVAMGLATIVQQRVVARVRVELVGWEQVGTLHVMRPYGWTQRRLGDAIVFEEPATRSRPGRRLEVSLRYAPIFMSPLEYLVRAEELSPRDLAMALEQTGTKTPAQKIWVWGWPGVVLSQDRMILISSHQAMLRRLTLGAVVLPTSEAVVIKLEGSGASDASDRELVSRVAGSINLEQVPRPKPAGGTLELADDILLTVPAELAEPSSNPPLRLDRTMMSLSAPGWLAVVFTPCWLLPGETGATLGQRLLLRDPAYSPGEIKKIDDHTWRCTRAAGQAFPGTAYLRTNAAGRGVIVEFRWSPPGGAGPDIEDLWRRTAETLAIAPTQTLPALLNTGAKALASVGADPRELWRGRPSEDRWQWFNERSSQVASSVVRRRVDDHGIWCKGTTDQWPPLSGNGREVFEWSIARNWGGYELSMLRAGPMPMLSQESRLERGLVMSVVGEGNRALARGETPVQPWFVPGGLLPAVLGRAPLEPMALQTESIAGIVDSASAVPLLVLAEPAFDLPRRLPNEVEPMRCWSVTISGWGQSSRWYYDATGQLRHIAFAGGVHMTAIEPPATQPATMPSEER